MKPKKIKPENSLLKKAKEIEEILNIQDEIEKPEWIKISEKLESLATAEEKIKFLEQAEHDYLFKNMTSAITASSGTISAHTPKGYPLFMHKKILDKKHLIQFEQELTIPIPENPLSIIDPAVHVLFKDKLKKALNKSGKWDSKIRCAAFCELLWDHKYLGEKKNRVQQCADFAKQWFPDLSNQLESGQNLNRIAHKRKLAFLFTSGGKFG